MATLHMEPERCKNCEFCISACPKEALRNSNDLNSGGYRYVEVDDEKCTYCGLCYTVCPDGVFEIRE